MDRKFVRQTTVYVLVKHARASRRTLYNHFDDKNELFAAVLDRFFAEQARLRDIPYDRDAGIYEQLERFADAELFLVNDSKRLALSRVVTSIFLNDPELGSRTQPLYGPPHAKLIAWLAEASADGRLRVDDPTQAARIFFAMIEGSMTWPALVRPVQSMRAFTLRKREMIETFLARCGVDI